MGKKRSRRKLGGDLGLLALALGTTAASLGLWLLGWWLDWRARDWIEARLEAATSWLANQISALLNLSH